MKTITLPVYNRPEYLKQTLNSLKTLQYLDEYILYINAEPGCQEVIDMINNINFIKTNIHINTKVLNCKINPFNLIDRAFNDNSEFNFHIEDDLIFAPDTLDLVNWYYENNKIFDKNTIIFGLCHRGSKNTNNEDVNKLIRKTGFTGLGWCTTKQFWSKYIRPEWNRVIINNIAGWDERLLEYTINNNLYELIPMQTRTNHIGKIGVHMTPSNNIHFDNAILCSNTQRLEFKIC